MRIYRVRTNKVYDEPLGTIVSSYQRQRIEKREEFYTSKEKADATVRERMEAIQKLAGFTDNIEFVVDAIEVIE